MKDKRDELVEELITVKKRSEEIREEIAKIDSDEREAKVNAMIGKCYALRFDHDSDDKEPYMFGRVEGHCQNGREIYGTEISIYRKDKKDVENGITCDGDMIQVELNHHIFDSYIDNGYEITKEEFNGYLQEAIDNIKLS